jgi:hypothetical protein
MVYKRTWKDYVSKPVRWFELSDYEYIKAVFGPWPFRFFITVYEPRRRWNWKRRLFPVRLRTSLANLVLSWIWSKCTVCRAKITLRELLKPWNNGDLIRFQSGSICHRKCSPPKDGPHA